MCTHLLKETDAPRQSSTSAMLRESADLRDAGLEEWRRVTVIDNTESSHNIVQEARILMTQNNTLPRHYFGNFQDRARR